MSQKEDQTTLAASKIQTPLPNGAKMQKKIGNLPFEFTVTADWLVLKEDDKPTAEIFYTSYILNDVKPRPVTFVFNGGPGASSAYLHMGGLGPYRIRFGDKGELLPSPSQVVENHETWLAFTDLVFVDPVGTGLSRASLEPETAESKNSKEKSKKGEQFYQLNKDLDTLGEFISRYLSMHRRWSAPIFIAGESYGGFRVAKLCRRLQEGFGIGLSGAMMISPVLEFSHLQGSSYDIQSWTELVPSLALSAFHHGRSRNLDTNDFDQAQKIFEDFAAQEITQLLFSGIESSEKTTEKLADYLGLPVSYIRHMRGRVPANYFCRELLKDKNLICGLYDASVASYDPFPEAAEFRGGDPTLFAIERMFNGGINILLRDHLGLDVEREYKLLSMDVFRSWKRDGDQHSLDTLIGATDDLRYAMALNPFFKLFICHGYFDLVTPYFSSKRILNHMHLPADVRKRVQLRNYMGGHMFYSWQKSRVEFFNDAQSFYK